ncbi:glycosyltransferase family 39 protein [Streptomyces sp. NPDC005408]|uniref:glycosyltransferase family 39 protein n=1 Tax=Streptomyces sp. NPDC005408 TaxID=3155341 RepID=UPI0033BB78A6
MRARRCPLTAQTFDSAAAAGARPVPRWRAALLRAAPALGLFAAARLTGLLVMAGWAWHIGRSPRAILSRAWDSDWYMLIAEHGYGRTLYWPDGSVQSDLAFFPLYPAQLRAVTAVLPVTSGTAGLLISWSAAAAAAWGIYAVVERLHGRRTATAVVLLWGLLPHSIVLSMAYTEPVLTAFAAWSLYALHTHRWLWAGVLASLAGLSRPNGIAVAAAVLAVAVNELVTAYRRRERLRPWRLRTYWRIWTGAALAPLGWCGYVLSVGFRAGDPLGGYFAVQRGWTSRFDFGIGALKVVRDIVERPSLLPIQMSLLVVAGSVLLFVLFALERPPAALLVYTAVLLLITVGGSGFFESKPRFLLPAFPLLLPLALALTKARPRAAVVVTVALAGLSFAYGTYLLTLSPIAL